MSRSSIGLLFVCGYLLVTFAVTLWSARRNPGAYEFFLAGRRLGPATVGLSSASSVVSGAVLIGLSSTAYYWGLAAVWTGLALLLGTLVNWFYVAPLLRALSLVHDSWSLTQVLAADAGERTQRRVAWTAAFIVIVALSLFASVQLKIAGSMMEHAFHWHISTALICALTIVFVYTVIGGLFAISVLGAIHALAMLCIVFALMVFAVDAVGGPSALMAALAEMRTNGDGWLGTRSGVVALAFVLGTLGPGLGGCGQPYITHRFMALQDATLMLRAGGFAIAWTLCMVLFALVVGWCAKVLIGELGGFDVLTELASRRMPTVLAVAVTFSLIASIVSSLDILLLLIVVAVSNDTRRPSASPSLEFARVFMPFVAVAIVLVALYIPLSATEYGAFAFNALSAAFAPLLLVRLGGKRIRAGSMLGAMWAGLFLTVIFHAMPDAPGDFLENVLPLVAALGIALTGGERRHNPDRANRAATTVHDRMPI